MGAPSAHPYMLVFGCRFLILQGFERSKIFKSNLIRLGLAETWPKSPARAPKTVKSSPSNDPSWLPNSIRDSVLPGSAKIPDFRGQDLLTLAPCTP